MQLRNYQKDCVNTIIDKFSTINTQIVQLPTGAGKTVILWHYLKQSKEKAIIVAPTRELTEQIYDTGCIIVGEQHVMLKKSSYWCKNKYKYLIMTAQGLTWLLKKNDIRDFFNPDILIFDEAHRSNAKRNKESIDFFKCSGKRCLGLTATPERLDGKSLLDVYDELTYTCTLPDLINRGYLVDLSCYKIKTRHSLKDIKYQMGDIAPVTLKQLDVDSRNSLILDIYLNRCAGKQALVFCLNVDHSIKMAEQFNMHGLKAAAIYGAMPRKERQQIIKDFKSGKIKILCNCQLLTEGFDAPCIEVLILARPTKSKSLYCQQIGRGVRPYKDKEHCLVYDLTDELHNICTFNVLGNMAPEHDFEWNDGETIVGASKRYEKEKHKLSLESIRYEVEQLALYERTQLSEMPAMPHQLEILKKERIPYLEDISIEDAAYLIFKTKLLRKNGFDSKTYWIRWKGLPPS